MKSLFTFLLFFAITTLAFAQTPGKMSYQAVIRNSSNQLVTNKTVKIKITILQGSANGVSVYSEVQEPTTSPSGLISIAFGGNAGFDTIDWAKGPYFVKTEIDPEGGANYTITGTSQMLSVPYAFYAKTAGNSFSGNYNDLTNKPISISDFEMDAKSKTITNLAAPVNDQDAITKKYVTLKVSSVGDTLFLGKDQFVIIPHISQANTAK